MAGEPCDAETPCEASLLCQDVCSVGALQQHARCELDLECTPPMFCNLDLVDLPQVGTCDVPATRGEACAVTARERSSCEPNYYCHTGLCEPVRGDGETCQFDTECWSQCEHGVCGGNSSWQCF
ncbi:MAG: hypothetical protein H6718_18665 [Polyangiaceae bacterium]|nr:hypothetical protein [Polyangiaceae bacterium]MCB9605773.1 hypothetical protein [Polyangiaceae bacterium]